MALTRIKDVGVDPAAAILGSKLTYLFSDTGGSPVSTIFDNIFAAQPLNAKVHFGAKGDGVTDDTDALNRALEKAYTLGRPLYLPKGVYVVSQVGSTGRCLFNKGVSMFGDGGIKTILTFATGTPGTVDMMLFAPEGGGTDFVNIENIGWWPGYPNFQTGVRGRKCIHFLFDAAGINMAKHVLRGNYFFPSNAESVEYENNPILLAQGNPSNSLIEHNAFWGGLKFGNCGDSNVIRNNIFRAPVSLKVGINIFVVNAAGGSAGHNVIRDNNIGCPGGAIFIQNGRHYIIDGNNIEQDVGAGTPSGTLSVVDIDGASGTVSPISITNNHIGLFGSTTCQSALRLNGVLNADVSGNSFFSDVTRAQAVAITASCTGARLGRNTFAPVGGGSNWTQPVNNSGVDTKSISYV